MKKLGLLILLNYLLLPAIFALDVNVSHSVFETAEGESYVEVYQHIVGNTIKYRQLDIRFQGEVDVIMFFKQGEDIIKFEKYTLTTPMAAEAEGWKPDLVDMRRVLLPPGNYTLLVEVKDKNTDALAATHSAELNIPPPNSAVHCSDISFIADFYPSENKDELFYRNGLFMEPLVHNFYHFSRTNLDFYLEVYKTQQLEDGILIRYYIEKDGQAGKALNDFIGVQKQSLAPVNILLARLDISDLPSGNYNLVVDVRNKLNESLLIKKTYFQRSNPYLETQLENWENNKWEETFVAEIKEEDLKYALETLSARIEPQQEKTYKSVLKSKDPDFQRRYLFTYWAAIEPNQPKRAFIEYMSLVNALNQKYKSSMMLGYQTDRGYVYLKYGPPNNMIESTSEPGGPPYEIWEYDKLDETQGFCKFIFYNPSLASNQFELLHSTANGEIYNPQWQRQLYRNVRQSGNAVDGTGVEDNYGNRAGSLFDQE